MNYHHVFQFPSDNEATLEAVLRQMRTGAVTSPMGDQLLTLSSVAEAIYVRCAFGDLRPTGDVSLLVREANIASVQGWLNQHLPTNRYAWAALEHFEFFHLADVERLLEVFSGILGRPPISMPLNLWPDVFPSSDAS